MMISECFERVIRPVHFFRRFMQCCTKLMHGKWNGKEMLGGEITVYLSLIFILLMTFVGGIMESTSIQNAKNYRRADVNRAMECVFAEYQKELLEEYDIFALDGSYETGRYASQNLTDRLSYYGAGDMEHGIAKIQFLTDRGGQGFCNQVQAYMEHKYGVNVMKDMLGMTEAWGRQEDQAEEYVREKQDSQNHLDELLTENEGQLPQEGNPISSADRLRQSPLLTLVTPRETAISEKRINGRDMPESRNRNKGYGEFTDVESTEGNLSSLILGEYLLEHFSIFTEAKGDGALDYELEYILAGKDSDQENLEAVTKKILNLRFVPNYTYIQTDSEMKAEAQTAAMALCTILAVPAITEAAEAGILLAWAYGEAIMDVRALLKGSKVPLAKSKESWQLQLSKLFILGTEEDQNEGRDDEHGLGYSDYLRMLLFLAKKDITALRSLGVIEQNMRKIHGQTYFRADYCISRIEISSVCDLRRGIQYKFRTCYNYN